MGRLLKGTSYNKSGMLQLLDNRVKRLNNSTLGINILSEFKLQKDINLIKSLNKKIRDARKQINQLRSRIRKED